MYVSNKFYLLRCLLDWRLRLRFASSFFFLFLFLLAVFFLLFLFFISHVFFYFLSVYSAHQCTIQQLFSNFFIKNRFYGTIHIFKNYFGTVFSVFSKNKLYPNRLLKSNLTSRLFHSIITMTNNSTLLIWEVAFR